MRASEAEKKEGVSESVLRKDEEIARCFTYHFAIEIMLPNHDSVDCFRVDKVEEGKTARATREVITHDGAVADLAELQKVAAKRFCKCHHQP